MQLFCLGTGILIVGWKFKDQTIVCMRVESLPVWEAALEAILSPKVCSWLRSFAKLQMNVHVCLAIYMQ